MELSDISKTQPSGLPVKASDSKSSTKVETDASIRNSVARVLLWIALVGSIAIVWSLISLPIIFHFLPQEVLSGA